MHVGILADAFPPTVGGMEIFAGQYVRELADSERVDGVDVLAFEEGSDERSGNLRIERTPVDGSLARWYRGLTWARRGQYDVIHSLSLYPSGVTAAVANRLGFTDRSFVTVYGTDALGSAAQPVHSRLRRFTFTNVTEVFFFSDSTRTKTHGAYGSDFASRTIYPGRPQLADGDESFEPPDTTGSFAVVTVCRLVERKGVDDLVAAVDPLDDVSLWIIGDGPERSRLERAVRDRGLEDRVAFVGEVAHDAIVDYYDSADVFAMPSVYLRGDGDVEGLGLVFLEAQQRGLPVIGTDSGGIPEAIADGESGFVVEPSSPDEIRRAVERLRDDVDTYDDFSENAVAFVEEKFSWEQCVREHGRAYETGGQR